MMLSMQLANSLHDDVFQGFDGCVGYPTLGLDPYDMLSAYGSLAGDLPPTFPAHCQTGWCHQINLPPARLPHRQLQQPIAAQQHH